MKNNKRTLETDTGRLGFCRPSIIDALLISFRRYICLYCMPVSPLLIQQDKRQTKTEHRTNLNLQRLIIFFLNRHWRLFMQRSHTPIQPLNHPHPQKLLSRALPLHPHRIRILQRLHDPRGPRLALHLNRPRRQQPTRRDTHNGWHLERASLETRSVFGWFDCPRL